MTRDVLEIEAEPLVPAMEVLDRNGIETAVFGSLLHATVEDGRDRIPVIWKMLTEAQIKVHRIDKIVPSLEDVFVTLIEVS
jgi:ABC-2 type transport system ATP-binding protein